MVDRLDKAGEDRLVRALDRVSDLVEDGSSPDDAVYKIASELKLSAGHVRLMANAFNTGRMVHLRKTASTLLEKTETLPLADAGKIVERLYPSVVKSASAVARSTAVSTEYLQPPKALLAHERARKLNLSMEKSASILDLKVTPLPACSDKKDRRAAGLLESWRKEVQEKHAQYQHARDKVAASYRACCDLLRSTNGSGFNEARVNLEAAYGKSASTLCKHLEAANRFAFKLASAKTYVTANTEPYSTLLSAVKAIQSLEIAKQAHEQALSNSSASKLEALVFGHAKQAADEPKREPGSTYNKTKGVFDAAGSGFGKGFMGTTGTIYGTLGKPDNESLDNKATEALSAPDHELELQQLQTKATLHDMMANDPVISGYGPEETIGAFNDLQRLAPRATMQPAVLRALLRKQLAQGAMDTHDLQQLLAMEKDIRGSRELPGDIPPGLVSPRLVDRKHKPKPTAVVTTTPPAKGAK